MGVDRACVGGIYPSNILVDGPYYHPSTLNTSHDLFMSGCLVTGPHNQRQLFLVIDKLTSPVNRACLPNHTCAAQLANTIADFFRHKIDRLRNQLDQCTIEDLSVNIADTCESSFNILVWINQKEEKGLQKSSEVQKVEGLG